MRRQTVRTRGWFVCALIALAVLAFTPGAVLAFTEPTEAPPGGAAAAPLNTSATSQTKLGDLHIGGSGSGRLYADFELCLGGVCYDDWAAVTGGTSALLNSGATPALFTSFGGAYDTGFLAIEAAAGQSFAVGAESADPGTGSAAGLYGLATSPVAGGVSYGVLGVTPIGASGNAFALGGVNVSSGLAGYFSGKVSVNYLTASSSAPNPQVLIRGLENNPAVAGDGGSTDVLSVYAKSSGTGSSLYVEQQGDPNFTFAGYFSGRVAVAETGADEALNVRGTDRVLNLDCAGTRCLDLDVERVDGGGGFVYQQFQRQDAEKWWFTSNANPGPGQDVFGLTARTGPAGGESSVSVLTVTPTGNVGIAGSTVPNPRLLVNDGVVDAGNVDNAVDIIASVPDTGLYVANPAPVAPVVGTKEWAAYFSGDTNFAGQVCLNDNGDRSNCISAWPAGGGSSYWTKTGSVVHPSLGSDALAIGGSDASAPFYFDPSAAFVALNDGGLRLNDGALVIQRKGGSGGGGGGRGRQVITVNEPSSAFSRFFSERIPTALASTISGVADRLYAKDGTITVEFTGPGEDKLEIGNAGRDIASTGDLYLRPGGLAAAASVKISNVGSGAQLSVANPDPGAAALAGYFNLSSAASTGTTLQVENSGDIASGGGLGDVIRAQFTGALNVGAAIRATNLSSIGFAGYFDGRTEFTASTAPSVKISNTAGGNALTVSGSSSFTNGALSVSHNLSVNPSASGGTATGVGFDLRTSDPAPSVQVVNLDPAGLAGRFYGVVDVRAAIAGPQGVRLGEVGAPVDLCLYGSGAEDCRNAWPTGIVGPGTTNRLAKFTGATSVGDSQITDTGSAIGQGVGISNSDPKARLVVNQNYINNGNSNDGIGVYSSLAGSALYAENLNNSGYAGYFSGRVNVAGSSSRSVTNSTTWAELAATASWLTGASANTTAIGVDATTLWTLDLSNSSATHIGGRFRTADVGNYSGFHRNYGLFVEAGNVGVGSASAGLAESYGLYAKAGDVDQPDSGANSIGVWAEAGSATGLGATNIGLYAFDGATPATPSPSGAYAAYFRGRIMATGQAFFNDDVVVQGSGNLDVQGTSRAATFLEEDVGGGTTHEVLSLTSYVAGQTCAVRCSAVHNKSCIAGWDITDAGGGTVTCSNSTSSTADVCVCGTISP